MEPTSGLEPLTPGVAESPLEGLGLNLSLRGAGSGLQRSLSNVLVRKFDAAMHSIIARQSR